MRLKLSISPILLIFIACLLAGCATLPTARDIRIQLGLERLLVHDDVPAAPSLRGVVRQLALGQTERMVIQVGRGSVSQTITDQTLIEDVLVVLRNSAQGTPSNPPGPYRDTILIRLYLTTPHRTVTVRYDPITETVRVFNIPNQAWPDHVVADYPVPILFGTALRSALQITP